MDVTNFDGVNSKSLLPDWGNTMVVFYPVWVGLSLLEGVIALHLVPR